METQLTYDNRSRSLGLFAKERFVSDDNVVFTVEGNLDTATGACRGKLALKKQFFPEPTNQFYTRANLGASYQTKTDQILYGVDAKKSFELTQDGLLTLDVKAGLHMSASRRREWTGKVALTQKIFNFTEDQDVKIKVGYDATRNRLFGQVRENNWTLDTDFVRTWALKYDL